MRSKKSILRSICASSKLKLTYGSTDSLVAAVISIPMDIDIPIAIDIDSDSGGDIITIFNITFFIVFIYIGG